MRIISPYVLLQEIYYPDKWKILVCCIFLNLTSRKQVDKMREEFFQRWPNPESVREEDETELALIMQPLGLSNKRAKTIIRFSKEFLQNDWEEPSELYGIGRYGQDSYDIFINNMIVLDPSDHVLKKYIKWLIEERRTYARGDHSNEVAVQASRQDQVLGNPGSDRSGIS